MFLALFLVGLLGFIAMAGLGFLHIGGHAPSTGHAHAPLGHGLSHGPGVGAHSHPASMAPKGAQIAKAAGVNKGTTKGAELSGDRAAQIFMLLSPVNLFSLMMGAGATGLLLEKALAGAPLFAAAGGGALVFCFAIVRPLINALGNFASRPSEGLEGMVAHSATAVTRFDREGRGLISLTLDGQALQVLAILESDECERGVQVAKGDAVTIVEVDKVRNTCRVTRELAS